MNQTRNRCRTYTVFDYLNMVFKITKLVLFSFSWKLMTSLIKVWIFSTMHAWNKKLGYKGHNYLLCMRSGSTRKSCWKIQICQPATISTSKKIHSIYWLSTNCTTAAKSLAGPQPKIWGNFSSNFPGMHSQHSLLYL